MKKRSFLLLGAVPIALWVASWILLAMLAPNPERAAQFGEMFGAVNALFAGLAIIGILLTYVSQQRNHAVEMEKAEAQLAIERRRSDFEARPVFSLQWRDSSVARDRSQFGIIVRNHGGPVIILQYTIRQFDRVAETGAVFQTCLQGKDAESPNVISPTLIGVLEYTYLQLRDGRRGTAKFDLLDSRHREPRFVSQSPGITVGTSIVSNAGLTIDNLPRLDLHKDQFHAD